MATSESDDFESADEEMNHEISMKRNNRRWCSPTTIDSESDDDVECVSQTPITNMSHNRRREAYLSEKSQLAREKEAREEKIKRNEGASIKDACSKDESEQSTGSIKETSEQTNEKVTCNLKEEMCLRKDTKPMKLGSKISKEEVTLEESNVNSTIKTEDTMTSSTESHTSKRAEKLLTTESVTDELNEVDMPEEMKSDKKFKEVFKPEGWEGLGRQTMDTENSATGWGWGSWGVSSLINAASVGVSTVTSHVSQGLMLLEESMGVSEEPTPDKTESEEDFVTNDDKPEQVEEQSSFGFGNLISGVSSITKLVETTGSKVMSGGLDTLEAIGKKTMEVLQDGDPGLKKKRAFFVNEAEKPILSQVLREAKEKAETIEKTIEEKQQMRKVHFESLFDDYQGLVHLEALEMLSKQSNIKIQQHLISLDTNELNSIQETLEEIKELCDLGDEDEKEEAANVEDLKFRLQEACNDLGISITYEKLYNVCEDSKTYLAPSMTHSDQEIFEHAISVLAQFTAFSVERFHKTAELLLIKDHRSTVNEADALVQLTHILSNQIGLLANAYNSFLNTLSETSDKPDKIKANITTVFMEASNASSYIQDAFKLLIPIIQVGAI
ncbi:protein FAM114A2 isoform X2 [Calliopsis andreniformis]|uniref:protein FAM114A2 isoform X2 n=1 Tax=Calliopsis andreniformis TaxID=337506 RepID=UPI003FCE7D24